MAFSEGVQALVPRYHSDLNNNNNNNNNKVAKRTFYMTLWQPPFFRFQFRNLLDKAWTGGTLWFQYTTLNFIMGEVGQGIKMSVAQCSQQTVQIYIYICIYIYIWQLTGHFTQKCQTDSPRCPGIPDCHQCHLPGMCRSGSGSSNNLVWLCQGSLKQTKKKNLEYSSNTI